MPPVPLLREVMLKDRKLWEKALATDGNNLFQHVPCLVRMDESARLPSLLADRS
jgi:hypothetical protein